MNIEDFTRRESMLSLRENLIEAREDRVNGSRGYSHDEISKLMGTAVSEVLNGNGK